MFEHLTNDKEQFRNAVIKANDNLYMCDIIFDSCKVHTWSEDSKIVIMKNFLEHQEELNNLYRHPVV